MKELNFNFDEQVYRYDGNAVATNGYRNYLFGDVKKEQFSYADDELLPMWIADMAFASPPQVVEAIQTRLANPVFGYTKVIDPQFNQSFVDWAASHYSWSCEQEHIVSSAGVIPALFELTDYICDRDDKIIIFTPSYAYFKHAANYHNIELLTSPLIYEDGSYRIDYEDFRKQTQDEKVSLCIFCHPHNPTGRLWSNAELEEFGNICSDNNVTIISDEIHCDILRNGRQHVPLAKLFPETDNIITCMAPSKTFNLAGLLFANIIIPNQNLRHKWKKKHYMFENPLSLAGVQAAYQYGQPWLVQLKNYLDTNFEFLQAFLERHMPKAQFRIPDATYFAWINVQAYFPASDNLTLFFAKNAGVILEGDNMFVDNAQGFIRLNLACPQAMLEQALKRIATLCN